MSTRGDMLLRHGQRYWSNRAASEPPSPTSSAQPTHPRMSTDPSGRYKGSNFDPYYHLKKSTQARSFDGTGQGYDQGYTSSAPHRPYDQQAPPRQNGYRSPNNSLPYTRDDGYSKHSYSAPSASNLSSRNTPIPTGPATSSAVPLPGRPLTRYESGSPPSSRIRPPEDRTRSLALDQEPINPPRAAMYANLPDWGKEDGEISSSAGPSTPSSAQIHPSRAGRMPELAGNRLNGQLGTGELSHAPVRTETPMSTDSRHGSMSQSQRSTRPAPLSFTPITVPPRVSTPAQSQQTAMSSPVTKSPLDSLEKLRQFKEQVTASRKSVSNMSAPEVSKLAQVAETFLKSQNPDASAAALEQLKRQMGPDAEGIVRSSSGQPATGRPKSALANSQASSGPPDRPSSRQAELKERLLALRSGRDQASKSPRDTSTSTANGAPFTAQVTQMAVANQKRARSPADDLAATHEEEQKRMRAQAWQRAQEREQAVQNAISNFRETSKRDHQSSQPSPLRRLEGPAAPPANRSTAVSGAPNGGDHRALAETSNRLPQPQTSARPPSQEYRDRNNQRGRLPETSRWDSRKERDIPTHRDERNSRSQDSSVESWGSPPKEYKNGSRRAPIDMRSDYRSDGSDSSHAPMSRPREPVNPERRVVLAPRDWHPPARRRSIEPEYVRPQHEPIERSSRDREPAPYRPSPAKSEQQVRVYSDRPAPQELVRYAAADPYARPAHPHPMPILVPLPAVDPATVHATLDILKAQIARLEQLVPSPVPGYEYAYERDPYRAYTAGAMPPPPQPTYRVVEYDDRFRDQSLTYESRRAAPSPPPLAPPQREYAYEIRRPAPPSPPSPPTYPRPEPAPRAPSPKTYKTHARREPELRAASPSRARETPHQRYHDKPPDGRGYQKKASDHHNNRTNPTKYRNQDDNHNSYKRSQGYDNRASGRGGHTGHHHGRGGSSSTRGGGTDRGGRGGGRGGYRH